MVTSFKWNKVASFANCPNITSGGSCCHRIAPELLEIGYSFHTMFVDIEQPLGEQPFSYHQEP